MTVPTRSVSETPGTLLKLAVDQLPLRPFTQSLGKFAQTRLERKRLRLLSDRDVALQSVVKTPHLP